MSVSEFLILDTYLYTYYVYPDGWHHAANTLLSGIPI